MVTESQGLRPSSAAWLGHKVGTGWELEQLDLTPIWYATATRQRISQLNHPADSYFYFSLKKKSTDIKKLCIFIGSYMTFCRMHTLKSHQGKGVLLLLEYFVSVVPSSHVLLGLHNVTTDCDLLNQSLSGSRPRT